MANGFEAGAVLAVVVYSAAQLLTFVFAPAPTTPKSPPISIFCMGLACCSNRLQPSMALSKPLEFEMMVLRCFPICANLCFCRPAPELRCGYEGQGRWRVRCQ